MSINFNSSDILLNDAKAAEVLGVSAKTLPVWRSTKRVIIPYVKVGRCVRYRMRDLIEFIESKSVTQ